MAVKDQEITDRYAIYNGEQLAPYQNEKKLITEILRKRSLPFSSKISLLDTFLYMHFFVSREN